MFYNLRVLIVEDNPINYMVMQNQLHKHGVTPALCTNGRAAMEYCLAHGLPDLILLDGCMPQMDGIEFLKWLRAEPQGNMPYVLFCSSSLDMIDVQEALRVGADKHYAKPLSQTALQEALVKATKRAEELAKTRTQSSKYHP